MILQINSRPGFQFLMVMKIVEGRSFEFACWSIGLSFFVLDRRRGGKARFCPLLNFEDLSKTL